MTYHENKVFKKFQAVEGGGGEKYFHYCFLNNNDDEKNIFKN